MAIHLKNWALRRANEFTVGPLNLEFDDGTVTTLIGPSGIGKTTLLMSVLGYEEANLQVNGARSQNGNVLRAGEIIKHALYVPQQFPFNPNWEITSFLNKLPWGNRTFGDVIFPFRSPRRRRIYEVLESLGLAHRARATIAELSGGEAQRAALAQMLLLKPKVIVGDEFVSALDPGMTTWILDQCRRQVVDSGGIAILALHDIQAAMHISDRILLLWSNDLERQPWSIIKGTKAWNGDVIYSLACLARWAKDLPGNAALHNLISRLSMWLENEKTFFDGFASFDERILVVDKNDKITGLRDTPSDFLPESFYSDNPGGMTAVRFNGQREVIGVIIPQGKERQPLRIISVNENLI